MTYLTNCVSPDGESINDMVDRARQIKYETFLRHVSAFEVNNIFPIYKDSGMHIKRDYHVTFWSSVFRGERCAFVCHSCIEYIFT